MVSILIYEHLSHFKLNKAERRNHIDKMPYVEKSKVDDALPSYLIDSEFEEMMSHTNEYYLRQYSECIVILVSD